MTPLQQFIQDLENVVDPETKEWIEKNKGFYIKLEEDEIVKAYTKAEMNSGFGTKLGKHYYRMRFKEGNDNDPTSGISSSISFGI